MNQQIPGAQNTPQANNQNNTGSLPQQQNASSQNTEIPENNMEKNVVKVAHPTDTNFEKKYAKNISHTTEQKEELNSAPQKKEVNKIQKHSLFSKWIRNLHNKKNPKKLLLAWLFLITTIIAFLFAIYVFLFITNLDLIFFTPKIEGFVADSETGEIVANASISKDEYQTLSDENGYYKLSIDKNSSLIEVKAKDFEPLLIDNFSYTKKIFNYTNQLNFVLNPRNINTLKGSFEAPDEGYDFFNDQIIINEVEYKISPDGTFEIELEQTGDIDFTFSSRNFLDINRTITIEDGENVIERTTLEPAGDIVGELKTYVAETPLENVEIKIENVADEQILLDLEKGEFEIVDLEIGREYKIRILADEFEQRDHNVTNQQGENIIPNLKFVEAFRTAFLKHNEEINEYEFSFSDLDGADENTIALDYEELRLKPFDTYFDTTTQTIFFLSDHGTSRGIFGKLSLPYSIDSTSSSPKALLNASDPDRFGTIYTNFKAKKLVNITSDERRNSPKRIEIMNLDGSETKSLFEVDSTVAIENILISDDGKSVYLLQTKKSDDSPESETMSEIILIDVDSKETTSVSTKDNIKIIDTSNDGKKIIYSANDTSTEFTDLLLYDLETRQTQSLITNEIGNDYEFLNNDDSRLMFWKDTNTGTDVFLFDMNTNSENKLTSLKSTDRIMKMYQQGSFVFYITEDGLYSLDPNSPHSYKPVGVGEYDWDN